MEEDYAVLEDWEFQGDSLVGVIYYHPSHEDGDFIETLSVVEEDLDKVEEYATIRTLDGVYKLGRKF